MSHNKIGGDSKLSANLVFEELSQWLKAADVVVRFDNDARTTISC
jgi:hypothetical protein